MFVAAATLQAPLCSLRVAAKKSAPSQPAVRAAFRIRRSTPGPFLGSGCRLAGTLSAAPRRNVRLMASASATPGAQRTAKLHDFCLTLPYGFLVLLGGAMGAALKARAFVAGSMKSLMMGGGAGAVLMGLGVLSLRTWKTGGSSVPFTTASAVIATALTAIMGKRFLASGAVFPAGVVAGLSAAMLLFYIYNLAAGGNPKPKPAKTA